MIGVACCVIICLSLRVTAQESNSAIRTEKHQAFGLELWNYANSQDYPSWTKATEPVRFGKAPMGSQVVQYLNGFATATSGSYVDGAVIVTEHLSPDGQSVLGITIGRKSRPGYDANNDDWYWIHYTPRGQIVKTSADSSRYAKRNYVAYPDEGRLWIFHINSPELSDFFERGELAKQVIQPGAGPNRMTLKSADRETILGYVAAKPGFETRIDDGRLWVFVQGCPELLEYETKGELAKHVIRPGVGPMGVTLKSPDAETIDAYLLGKPGFYVQVEDGRLWVFREGSQELQEFRDKGEPAKCVIRPGAGPDRMTLKGPDNETLDAYIYSAAGFVTKLVDERLWVFRAASDELKQFESQGELAKHVIRPGAGPGGITLKAPDAQTLDAYLSVLTN